MPVILPVASSQMALVFVDGAEKYASAPEDEIDAGRPAVYDHTGSSTLEGSSSSERGSPLSLRRFASNGCAVSTPRRA